MIKENLLKILEYASPDPVLMSSRQEGNREVLKVEMQHDGIAAGIDVPQGERWIINSNCRGTLIAEFSTLEQGTKIFNCNGCGLPVGVSLDVLMLQIGKFPRNVTRERNSNV